MKGERLQRSDTLNREIASVGMTFGLDGWTYGPQFNVARANFTAGMADCFDAPGWAPKFDDQVYTIDKRSASCLMSKSECGQQTSKTFLQQLKFVKEQVDNRNVVEVGRPLDQCLSALT